LLPFLPGFFLPMSSLILCTAYPVIGSQPHLPIHPNSIEKIFPRIGETTTTDEVLSQLQEQARPTNIAVPQ
jgi:hypothetical protein